MILVPNQAVILAGGQGERLRPLTNEIPKPMVHVNNYPFLDYLINSLIQIKIKNILILVGYKADKIISHYSNVKGVSIEFSHSDECALTGKRIINAKDKLSDCFLLVYGDNYWNVEFEDMVKTYNKMNCPIMTTVYSNKNFDGEYGKSNNIRTDLNLVVDYDKSRRKKNLNGVEIGYYIIQKKILDFNNDNNFSFEEIYLPLLIKKKQLSAYVSDNRYFFITDLKSLSKFEKNIKIENIQPIDQKMLLK